MRLTWWTMLGLTVLAIGSIATALLGATAPASCGKADDSRDAGLLGQAGDEYASIRADEPGNTCATSGVTQLASAFCARAGVLDERDDPVGAEKDYERVLALEPPAKPCGAQRSCLHGSASEKAGLYAQADKAYAAVLDKQPDSACASAGIATIAAALCHRADRLRSAGQNDSARQAYIALLNREPVAALTCVKNGLAKLTTASTSGRSAAPQTRR
jgi:tetratricopeptide (TPR) repeat protein